MEKGALIGQGRTAEIYAWGPDRVLKLYFNWMSRQAVEWEYRVTRSAHEAGIPVPSVDELVVPRFEGQILHLRQIMLGLRNV